LEGAVAHFHLPVPGHSANRPAGKKHGGKTVGGDTKPKGPLYLQIAHEYPPKSKK
jgi:hypothetical protein